MKNIRPDVTNDYLIVPVTGIMNNRYFDNGKEIVKVDDKNECKVICGVTGQGKTWSTAKVFIPLFFKLGGRFAVYTVPMNEIMDADLFQECALHVTMNATFQKDAIFFVNNDLELALEHLKMGRKVLLVTTNKSFFTKTNGKRKSQTKLIDYMMTDEMIDKFSLWSDEIHTWSVSCADNYQNATGNPKGNGDYLASMYKTMSKLSKNSSFIYGITATPNDEHLEYLAVGGTMKFNVINSMPPKELLVGKTAWMKTDYPKTYNVNDEVETEKTLINFLSEIREDELKTGNKLCTMFTCFSDMELKDGVTNKYNIQGVRDLIIRLNKKYKWWPEDEVIFSIMISKGNETFSTKGNYDKKISDEEIKRDMNDLTNPLRFILAIEKGKCGMNIFPLKNYFSFRPTDKKNDTGKSITNIAKQIMGRCVRLFTGEESLKGEYDLEKLVLKSNSEQLENLLINNSFRIVTPQTPMWDIAHKEFVYDYVSTVKEAEMWIENVRNKPREFQTLEMYIND